MAAMTEITCKCGCGEKKTVRVADVKRGWGLYASKSCKAKDQMCRPDLQRSRKPRKTVEKPKSERVEYLRDAWERGDISDEYYISTMESEYLEFMNAEDFHMAAEFDCHPFSSDALGQD